MLEVTCTNEQKIKITANPVTATGKLVALDGALSILVQSGDGNILMEGDNAFWVISGDNPGDTTYLVSGDADLGDGVETISDIVILHVEGAKAVNLGLYAEAPVPK